LPLRVFLGFTFAFAGLQKLANPGFFDASNPASIQAQLAGAARRSPIHALVAPLAHAAVPLGILIALAEVAVGLGALLGLWTRVAAAGGMALSLMLFVTVSFHSSPYYTGSDIVFVFAWIPLLLAGSAGAVSADALVAEVVRRRAGQDPALVVPTPFSAVRLVCGSYDEGSCQARRGAPCEPVPCPYLSGRSLGDRGRVEDEMSRRTFAAQGAVAAAAAVVAVVGGGLAAGIGRLIGGSPPKSGPLALGVTGGYPTTTNPPTTTALATSVPGSTATAPTTTTTPTRPQGTAIGMASQVPVGGAGSFNNPSTGDPSLVIQPRAGTFLAFDAVCPHAGCTVQYDNVDKVFVCPCHGSQFNANTGAVEQGPAATGLQRIKIAEGPNGELYAV
jgi:thiosulfate dehydrogenase [quinone] large subunit